VPPSSLSRVDTTFAHLRADGAPEERLAQVHAPIGLDLGGRRPEEIVLAILAEIEPVRHGGRPQPRAARTA
jgi:xanthine dehydrogenase accessory factor